jgi:ubiquinone/menaquinone biosynthesis C-methylase UbiE
MSTERFDQLAATWDDDPLRQALIEAVAEAIQADVPLRPEWTALDYGGGTAALSFRLSGKLRHIVAADTSPGMLEQAGRKLAASGTANIELRQLDLGHEPPPPETFNLIICCMSLHHVEDLHRLAAAFSAMLAPGGWLAIADLHAEDGSFHQGQTVPHNGFEPVVLGNILAKAGLAKAVWRTIHTMERHGNGYPIFLLTMQQPIRKHL